MGPVYRGGRGHYFTPLIRFRRPKGDNQTAYPLKATCPWKPSGPPFPLLLWSGLGLYSVVVFQEMGGFFFLVGITAAVPWWPRPLSSRSLMSFWLARPGRR